MQVKINAKRVKTPYLGLPMCRPVLMHGPSGRVVVVLRAVDEALCFDTDNSICHAKHEYFNPENGYTFIRELSGSDSFTVKGNEK